MEHWQAIGTKLNAVTAITDLVGNRIYHGMRPTPLADGQTVQFPCINYFELSGPAVLATGVVETRTYQISARCRTPEATKALSEEIEAAFQNMQETIGATFSVNFGQVIPGGGILYESVAQVYHVPVTIRVIFNSDQI